MSTKLKIVILFFLLAFSSKAQPPLTERKDDPSESKFFDRVFFGGSFGIQFGTQTYVELSPTIGYKITDRLSAGIGLKYIYYKLKDRNYTYSTNIYGGGPFTRFFVTDGLFLHAEYEVLNMEVPDAFYFRYVRKNITSVFLGVGYRQMIGDRSSLDLLLLYNINDNRNSPYINPIIRIGFGFGI
jgi:outer membrane protein assembly factor BamA